MSFFKNLFGHNEAQNAHRQVYGDGGDDSSNSGTNDYQGGDQREHKSSFTHELIAGAAGFAALKAYEDHVRRSGEQVSHPLMKEMLAGFAAAEVDKLCETKGLDYLDREKAKRMAVEQAHHLAHEKYGPGQTYQGDDSSGYQQQGYNQSVGYEQGRGQNDYNQGRGQNDYNQGRGQNDYNQGRGQNDYNQDYEGGNRGGGYQQNQNNNYDQGAGGDYDNYRNQGQQQQQWGDGDNRPMPEHHRHHRREEDD